MYLPAASPSNRNAPMTEVRNPESVFAVAHDVPVPYLQRVRSYYQALGYGAPYEWAHYGQVPFQTLTKPLAACRVALITTAAPYQPENGDQGPGAPYNAKAKFYRVYSRDAGLDHDLRISHLAIDRQHTTGEDIGTYFPLRALRECARSGRIGAVSTRFHGAPTNRSQRVTLEVDGPEIVARCVADGADAAILVPNCPVCHQTASLIARLLEERSIATVVMGCAKDIVEHIGVPRFLFSDFPLGNAAGRPRDGASQAYTIELALKVLEAAPTSRTTVQSPLRWSDNAVWKLDYCNIERLSGEELTQRRADFDQGKAEAARLRRDAGIAPPTTRG
jgi:hypothetical protein